jgi:hypothetical protein
MRKTNTNQRRRVVIYLTNDEFMKLGIETVKAGLTSENIQASRMIRLALAAK